jgi:uncharacterized protein (TIGR02594 family)
MSRSRSARKRRQDYDEKHPDRKLEDLPGLSDEQKENLKKNPWLKNSRLGFDPQKDAAHPADTPPATAAPDVSSSRLVPATTYPAGAHGVQLLDAIPTPTIPTTPGFKTPAQMQREQFQGKAVRLTGGGDEWDTSHYGAWADMLGGPMSDMIEDRRGGGGTSLREEHNKLLFENNELLKQINDWLQGLTGGPGGGTMPGGGLGRGGGGVGGAGGGGGGAFGPGVGGGGATGAQAPTFNPATGAPVGPEAPPNAGLAEQRARIGQELQNPEVQRLLAASTEAEVGGQGAAAKQGYIESVMNRALSRHQTLAATLSDPKYYPASTASKLGRTNVPDVSGITAKVLGGSNISNFSTGNESGSVRSGGAPIGFDPGTGERFVQENADRRWVRSAMAGGGGAAVGLTGAVNAGGGGGVPGPAGDPTVPGGILARARQVAMLSGPGGVERFMASQGYPKAGNWCGEFAASVVKSAGYIPPKGAAIASNWRNWGTVDPTPHVGDIAVANRGVATGATGSHVTVVSGIDPSTGTFTGLGGNQRAGWESQFATGGYTFRRPGGPGDGDAGFDPSAFAGGGGGGGFAGGGGGGGGGGFGGGFGGSPLAGMLGGLLGRIPGPFGGIIGGLLPMLLGGGGGGLGGMLGGFLNRGVLNAGMNHTVTGSADINVNVAAPPGTNVAAKSAGLFKPVALTRQTQMMRTQGGPHNVGNFDFGNA